MDRTTISYELYGLKITKTIVKEDKCNLIYSKIKIKSNIKENFSNLIIYADTSLSMNGSIYHNLTNALLKLREFDSHKIHFYFWCNKVYGPVDPTDFKVCEGTNIENVLKHAIANYLSPGNKIIIITDLEINQGTKNPNKLCNLIEQIREKSDISIYVIQLPNTNKELLEKMKTRCETKIITASSEELFEYILLYENITNVIPTSIVLNLADFGHREDFLLNDVFVEPASITVNILAKKTDSLVIPFQIHILKRDSESGNILKEKIIMNEILE